MDLNDPQYREIVRSKCEDDHLYFTRFFFKQRNGFKFIVNWHHYIVASTVQQIIDGEIKNVVINVPPGSSKTELVIINLIARGLAINPRSRFLHISCSDTLALLNSETARDMVQSEEFQTLWPLPIATDAKSKARWNVVDAEGRKLGGVYAVSLGGQITGFRAGHMSSGFNGAILIDDPLKADEAFSKPAKAEANRRLISTVKSRKALPDTPVIVIMQRLAEDDPTAFIKAGNLPGKWHCVEIPALLDETKIVSFGPEMLSHCDASVRDEQGRFSYWQQKEALNELLDMERGAASDKEGNRISRFVFSGQYQQSPVALGGNLIRGQWFPRVPAPKIVYRTIYADTAQKTGERNDYSVFQCWGKGEDDKIYLLDMIRGKWEAPDLKRAAIDFWIKHKSMTDSALRQMKVEDKASGTGLIQDLRRGGHGQPGIPIVGIERHKDKLTRVMDVVAYIECGSVCLPLSAPWINDFISECEAFTSDDSHAHDDQVDPMCDAISDFLGVTAGPNAGFFQFLNDQKAQP
ncbi:phage terminase large subunit [Rhodopila sp.]|uniref:phage terminase large subunit n=1 Tax=Rhodopila sp. TaxID=2480087 RepID=UPI003D0AD2C3